MVLFALIFLLEYRLFLTDAITKTIHDKWESRQEFSSEGKRFVLTNFISPYWNRILRNACICLGFLLLKQWNEISHKNKKTPVFAKRKVIKKFISSHTAKSVLSKQGTNIRWQRQNATFNPSNV